MGIKKLLEHNFLLGVALCYTGLITLASLWRFIAFNPIPFKNGDKLGHCIAYFGFTLVWFLFFFYSNVIQFSFKKCVQWAAVFAFFYGLSMEAAQGWFTDYRMPEFMDVLANTAGVILAVILVVFVQKQLIGLKSE